jgi:phosphatidylglycerophosphate synthase
MVASTTGLTADKYTGTRPPTVVDALLTFVILWLSVTAVSVILVPLLGLSGSLPLRTAVAYAAGGALVVWFVAHSLAPARFGAANRVTSVRVSLVALIASLIGESPASQTAWLVVGLAVVALILDGIDGWLARRGGQASSFGARFDMETDAALTLALAVLCWQFDKAGAWILAVGMMRYGFVAAAALAPWLARPLPYSRRRQAICVLQLAGLLVVLSPLVAAPLSSAVGLLTLMLLAVSFLIDVDWLRRARDR